jgi:hypothetical protein
VWLPAAGGGGIERGLFGLREGRKTGDSRNHRGFRVPNNGQLANNFFLDREVYPGGCLDGKQDEVRLRFRGSTDNLSPTLRFGKSDVYRSERTALVGRSR